MIKKLEKNKKSVSNLLDKAFGEISPNYTKIRGKIIHKAYSNYYRKIFKTSDRNNKINNRVFSQRIYKAKMDELAEIKKNLDYEIFHEDVKVLLNTLQNEIRQAGKILAKKNNGIVVPKEIEINLFDGEASFEVEAIGRFGGFKIPARVDCLIENNSDSFVVRDFKSCERNNEDDPTNPESQHHRSFMQVCLYAIIFERVRHQKCELIQLEYFPNKIVSYEFTQELKETAKKFAIETAFDGFEGITFQFQSEDNNNIDMQLTNLENQSQATSSALLDNTTGSDDILGWINTIKRKPLQLIMGQDNKMEGFLYPNKAHRVKDGYCVIVEKEEDGVRIMCMLKKIECSEDHYPGETASHKEENYKITLIPVGQFTAEGYQELKPQTIIGGKIKIPTNTEFCEYKKIPQNGMHIGRIQGLNTGVSYPIDLKNLYQSTFISGQQGTGKTTSLKTMTLQMAQEKYSPAVIILDNEGEYGDLKQIPSNERSEKVMENCDIRPLKDATYNYINISNKNGCCLTLKAIDPVDLPNFLHELTPTSHDILQTIIFDIIEDNEGKDFTLPELRKSIIKYMDKEIYGAAYSTKDAIRRAMTSISLKIFDDPNATPIDFETMLTPGKITIINSYNLRDIHQRIVGLYLLAILHKRALKGKEKLRVIFILDEVQRLLPNSKSQADSDYSKRIIKFLDEVVHRGRKRDYGVIFATQSVKDVKKEIIDLCNTKFFFQTQGSGLNYIKEYFSNKEDLERLKRLPQGYAFITSKGKHEPVEIKFPYII